MTRDRPHRLVVRLMRKSMSASLMVCGVACLVVLSSCASAQLTATWQDLTELQRAERVIQFACLKALVNELVKEEVAVTKQYQDGDPGFEAPYKRYENQNGWVDLDSRRDFVAQEDRRGYFTVRRAGIKNIAHFPRLAFLERADRAAVRRFFLEPKYSAAMRTSGNEDVIPGEVAEITFTFEHDKLQSLTLDCSL